jgi:Domain of unknown function (DUF4177)
MTRWEYQVFDVAGEAYADIEETLNELGEQGWELICTTETDKEVRTLWLKREKR